MDRHFYHTSQFARKAKVSVRALRYYDRIGLLCPAQHSESGYRLYADADVARLQQILALKFLGFSLEEIRRCLGGGPSALRESLAQQKAMLQERRSQIDTIIRALDEADDVLERNDDDWEAIVHVIQVMQMTQSNEWRKKYLTEEQIKQMEELSKASYTEEDRQKLQAWGANFSEQDQQRATQQWNEVIAEVRRLVAAGSDPAGAEAQAWAGRYLALIEEFTHGDPGITAGLKRYYTKLDEMPAEQRAVAMPFYSEDWKYIEKAVTAYQERQG
ncbi:MAG TPA: MerR family transcriptional regulator [Ktedonobacteraceae bacterium]|nr:MerR family transcriptional regulator [Ktedonobacteraceae bacterium]